MSGHRLHPDGTYMFDIFRASAHTCLFLGVGLQFWDRVGISSTEHVIAL
jgi:hypothetical protein